MKRVQIFLLGSLVAINVSIAQTTVTLSTAETSTWTVPTGVTSIDVQVWGAGGGGGGGDTGNRDGGGGGGGGGYSASTGIAVTPGQVIAYTVGAGGAGGQEEQDGTDGEASTILAVTADGGQGGNSEGDAGNRNGGNGGTGTVSDGGDGGNGHSSQGAGGGGEGGCTTGDGDDGSNGNGAGNGAGGTGCDGGDGGAGSQVNSGAGSPGAGPGGGGGGGTKDDAGSDGAAGANGRIVITYVAACDPCYSVANGDWSDASTWSDMSGGSGGFSPLANNGSFIIEGGHTVTIDGDVHADSIIVGTTTTANAGVGILNFDDDHILDMEDDGEGADGVIEVRSGSSIDRNGNDPIIRMDDDNDSFTFTVNDNTNGIDVGDIIIAGDDITLVIAGATGKIDLTDDFVMQEDNAVVTNNMTGTIAVGDDFRFGDGTSQADGNTFTNNGTITIADELEFDDQADNNSFIGGASSSTTVSDKIEFKNEGHGTDNRITNDGLIAVTNKIEVDQGDITVTNTANGVITVGTNIEHNNDDGYFNVVNSGQITVTGNLVMTASDMTSDYTNSGTLEFAVCHASDGDLDIVNTGTINQSGTFEDVRDLALFTNSTNGFWNYGGTTHDNETIINCSASPNTWNYNGAGDQEIIRPDFDNDIGVQDDYHHVQFTNSGTKQPQGSDGAWTFDVAGNLTISGAASLDVDQENNDITIEGNWINTSSGDFMEGTEDVTFDGSGPQGITCSAIGTETFYNLFVYKTGGNTITMNDHVTVSNTLDFNGTNGYIAISGNDLTISNWDNGDIAGYDTDEFIIVDGTGFIKYTGVDDGEVLNVPMGLATGSTNYALANLTMTDAGAGTLDATLCSGVGEGGACGGAEADSVVAYTWNFVSTSTSSTVQLYWDSSKELTDFDRSMSAVTNWNGSGWENLGAYGAAAAEGGSLYSRPGSASRMGLFSLNMGGTPLPVELIGFDAQLKGEVIEISWSTASEINNDKFIVQRSVDGVVFDDVSEVPSAGNSFVELNYSTTDQKPFEGANYYRLKQVDFDGRATYSAIVFVNLTAENEVTGGGYSSGLRATLYPNPVSNGQPFYLSIDNKGEQKEIVVIMLNAWGQEVYSKLTVVDEGNSIVAVDVNKWLSPGIYFVVGSSDQRLFHKRVVVRR